MEKGGVIDVRQFEIWIQVGKRTEPSNTFYICPRLEANPFLYRMALRSFATFTFFRVRTFLRERSVFRESAPLPLPSIPQFAPPSIRHYGIQIGGSETADCVEDVGYRLTASYNFKLLVKTLKLDASLVSTRSRVRAMMFSNSHINLKSTP